MSVRVNKENIQSEVIESEIPVLLEFYSSTCIPCKALSPVLAEIEEENENKIKVCKVNTTVDFELAQEYEVMATPTILFFENGQEFDRIRGVASKDDILEKFGG